MVTSTPIEADDETVKLYVKPTVVLISARIDERVHELLDPEHTISSLIHPEGNPKR